MSVRLRLGDFFAIPLPDGQIIRARLVARAGRVATLAYQRKDGSTLALRTLDAAMHERRWETVGGHAQPIQSIFPLPTNSPYDAARTERAFLAFLSHIEFEEPYRCTIYAVGSQSSGVGKAGPQVVYTIDHTAHLVDADLSSIVAGADRIRIDARSPYLAEVLAHSTIRDLVIIGAHENLDLRELRISTTLEHLTLMNVTVLSLGSVRALTQLQSLDLRRVRLTDSLAHIGHVPILRIRGVTGITTIADVLSPARTHLAIESQRNLRSLDELSMCELDGLTLLHLPQLGREAFDWTIRATGLSTLTLDIGARRIQAEVRLPRPIAHAPSIDILREKSLRRVRQVASPS